MTYRRSLAVTGAGALAGAVAGALWGGLAAGPDSALGTALLCLCAGALVTAVAVRLGTGRRTRRSRPDR